MESVNTHTLPHQIGYIFENTFTFDTLYEFGKRQHYINQPLNNKSYIEDRNINVNASVRANRFIYGTKITETLQGSIYQATDSETNNEVIIKKAYKTLIKNGKSRDKRTVHEDFLKERGLLLHLSKTDGFPNSIIKILASWDDINCYYYVMEKCICSLFEFVSKYFNDKQCVKYMQIEANKQQRVMKFANNWIQTVAHIFEQICNATQYLHENRICHLDLSLENVMIYNFNPLQIKVIDFGLARVYDGNLFRGAVGKIKYMSPETYNNEKYDGKAADIYCLGVTLFMMLIGAEPYQIPFYNIENNNDISTESGDRNFRDIVQNGNIKTNLNRHCRLRLVTNEALDLLHNMLTYESNRIALEDVITHEFFDILCCKNQTETEHTKPIIVSCNGYIMPKDILFKDIFTDLDKIGNKNIFNDRNERNRNINRNRSRSRSRSRNRNE